MSQQRTHEFQNHTVNTNQWELVNLRNGDVVVATWAKSGTTWMQQIVAQLHLGGNSKASIATTSPWVEFRPTVDDLKGFDRQAGRRVMKTHVRADAVGIDPKAKYIFVGRDGRDVALSLHHHLSTAKDELFKMINAVPDRVGPELERPVDDFGVFFDQWLAGDGAPFWEFWKTIESWLELGHLPNVHIVHFNDLKQDLEQNIRAVAAFLDIEIDETKFASIVEHCRFDWVKQNSHLVAPAGGFFWENNGFFRSGTNGDWANTLTNEQSQRYNATAKERLGDAGSRWLEHGGELN